MKEIKILKSSLWYATLVMFILMVIFSILMLIYKLNFKYLVPYILTLIVVFLLEYYNIYKLARSTKNNEQIEQKPQVLNILIFGILIFLFPILNKFTNLKFVDQYMFFIVTLELVVYLRLFYFLSNQKLKNKTN